MASSLPEAGDHQPESKGRRLASGKAATLTRATRSSALRFLLVGGLSFLTDAGALYLLHGVLGVWLPAATASAFASAFVVNFGLNRLWAFRAGGPVHRQLRRYLSLVLANLLLTVVLVPGLTWLGLPYLVAKTCTTVALAVANYLVSRRWIFVR
jgi:putative flippase GtrA